MSSAVLEFEGIGTYWKVRIYQELAASELQQLQLQLLQTTERFDHHFSRFRSDSLVTQLYTTEQPVQVPSHFSRLFAFYKTLHKATDGLFTPCIGERLEQLGYDAEYSLQRAAELSEVPSFDAVELHDSTLSSSQKVLLDFGAAGKGYLVDLLAKQLHAAGYPAFTIDGSGDLSHSAAAPLRVGLEHPHDSTQVLGVLTVPSGKSLCASANNRRTWQNQHHIISPDAKPPQKPVLATWVLADSALEADGVATALFLVPPEKLSDYVSCSYLLVYSDLSYTATPDFTHQLYTR